MISLREQIKQDLKEEKVPCVFYITKHNEDVLRFYSERLGYKNDPKDENFSKTINFLISYADYQEMEILKNLNIEAENT